jgi:hypothetical protein
VAGAAALVYIQNPTWTYTQVKAKILGTARPIAALAGLCVTGGVLDVNACLGGAAPNTAPTVTITSPAAASSTFTQGVAVTFTGSATDLQDGALTAGMTWTSSLQGVIGTGGSFTTSTLSLGTHVITARATDSGGLTTSVTRNVTIAAPVAPIAPDRLRLVRSGTTVTASWRDRSTNETGFEVRREVQVNGVFTNPVVVGTVGSNIVSFANTGVTTGVYRYAVRAVNGSAASAWSATVTITVP